MKFERRVTPILVRWLYVLALVVIASGTVFGLLWVWSFASWMGWAMWLAAPIVVGLAVLLVVRIICEHIIAKTQPVPRRRLWPTRHLCRLRKFIDPDPAPSRTDARRSGALVRANGAQGVRDRFARTSAPVRGGPGGGAAPWFELAQLLRLSSQSKRFPVDSEFYIAPSRGRDVTDSIEFFRAGFKLGRIYPTEASMLGGRE
ncbi:DUF4282 domain-containing protein [Actinomadura verrucosospora]|uniref:DUF4282 domain-containing protein n=1 Tax=Actinomadura verrucosospora TaxID=46165 RepID=UPI001565608C